jgi:uncharacterized protein YjbI with pentapeptide repeats
MSGPELKESLTLLTALVGLIGAIIGLYKYFNYRTRKDRVDAVGARFSTVVEALGSENRVKRLVGAIMLRRFFDPESEFGVAGTPYAKEAANVIAAILRDERSSNFQKLLADGLRFAGSLRKADLQKTNLQNAHLGESDKVGVDLSGADFYRADLSDASLKGADAQGAVFYQARLANTRLQGADLRRANFFEADLKGALFKDAQLEGASFKGARNIPQSVARHLDGNGDWVAEAVSAETKSTPAVPRPVRIFFSRPAVMRANAGNAVEALQQHLARLGMFELVELGRSDYPSFGSLVEARRVISGCTGMVVVGVGELDIAQGTWRAGTSDERALQGASLPSPWCQIETGIAIGLDLPVLLFAPLSLEAGVFARDADGHLIFRVDGLAGLASGAAQRTLDDWYAAVRERAAA